MTNDDIQKLRDERVKLITDMRTLLDTADTEKRDVTSDEDTNYQNMEKRLDKLTDEIKTADDKRKEDEERLQRLAEKEEALKNSQDEPTKIDPSQETETRTDAEKATAYEDSAERRAFCAFLTDNSLDEYRALQADIDVSGGFLVAPEQFVKNLIKDINRMVFVRQFATVISVPKAESLGVPELGADPADADWTAEIKTGGEDSTMAFEKRELRPHPCAKMLKVSNKLIRISQIPIDGLVRDRLGYKFGITQEKAFLSLSGTGVGQPLSMFVANNSGITTGRDVSAGNTTTAIKADNLVNVKYSLEAQYRMKCRWLFHRDGIKMIRKLKDGEGNYIWKAGISSDRPDTILEFPVHESEYVPNTWTTGLYVGILGDLSFYWIVDALSMNIQVLQELYARTNQTGYIGRLETDGAPVHEKAFARVKLA